MRKLSMIMAIVMIFILGTIGSAAASDTMLASFTQEELDNNWVADREFPTGGVTSVTAFGRDNVAQLSIDSEATHSNTFRRTEGIKTAGAQDFGSAVQVDLYLDPAWANTAVRAGLWVVGDDGSGQRDDIFGILEFINLEHADSGESAHANHEGWRYWTSATGWTNLTTDFNYGSWVTLAITLDTEEAQYDFAIDGNHVAHGPGGTNFISEVFLNSYNYGLDEFPNLSNGNYAAHWHAGVVDIDPKDQCKEGGWQTHPGNFKNQGQCIKFINTGK